MELFVLVKGALIDAGIVVPLESSLGPQPLMEFSLVRIVFSDFNALALEFILLEPPHVPEVGRDVFSLSFGLVVMELPVVVRAVREDKHPLAFGLAPQELSHVQAAILFVHLAEAVRSMAVLN